MLAWPYTRQEVLCRKKFGRANAFSVECVVSEVGRHDRRLVTDLRHTIYGAIYGNSNSISICSCRERQKEDLSVTPEEEALIPAIFRVELACPTCHVTYRQHVSVARKWLWHGLIDYVDTDWRDRPPSLQTKLETTASHNIMRGVRHTVWRKREEVLLSIAYSKNEQHLAIRHGQQLEGFVNRRLKYVVDFLVSFTDCTYVWLPRDQDLPIPTIPAASTDSLPRPSSGP